MLWLTDALQVAAILLFSAGFCAGALIIAKRTGLARFWIARDSSAARTEQLIEQLAQLSDAARRDGIVAIENVAAAFKSPILDRGLTMLISGAAPAAMRETLEDALDESVLHGQRAARFASTALWILSFVGLLAGCIAAATLAARGSGPSGLVWAAGMVLPAALALGASAIIRGRSGQTHAEAMLRGMIFVEAVLGIAARKDGRAVRTVLRQFLPSTADSAAVAAAA